MPARSLACATLALLSQQKPIGATPTFSGDGEEIADMQSASRCVLVSFINLDHPPSCARRFFTIADALCRSVGNAIRPGFIDAAMALMVCRRIMRVRGLLLALEARFLAGTLRAPRVAVVAASRGEAAARVTRAWLPRRFAWLCVLVPGDAACFAGQLRVVMAEPGMVALLGSSPQAVRAVGPLCRMLGIAREDFVPRADQVVMAVAALAAAALIPARPVPVAEQMDAGTFALATAGLGWIRFIPG
jgi:hypothetical protein